MQQSGKIPVINKIITIKNDIITIRYDNKELCYDFDDIHDIGLTKMKIKKNIIMLNFIAFMLTLFPILFYSILDNAYTITLYTSMLLLFLHFKSNRYEMAYYLKITLNNGYRHRLRIYSKDRLDVIRETTSYIDYRFKKSMQELFKDLQQSKPIANSQVS